MFPDNLTRAEAKSRSKLVEVSSYQVAVDLTGRHVADPETTFLSSSRISFTGLRSELTHVDLIADGVEAATLNGAPLDVGSFDGSRLHIDVAAGPNELTVSALCRFSRSGEGLHRFVDPSDGRIYHYTQFEVAEARRVYACFDQPDLKGRFEISVLTPSSWTVVSNGSERSVTVLDPSFSRWDFHETPPLSSYLTGLVAGDYHTVTDSYAGTAGEIAMSVLCRQSLVDHLDANRVLATTKAGFAVFEKHFGYPYAFGKYDQVFVPEYNGGAMENAGCVTLRDDYLYRSRVTTAAYESRDNTILHELSHMWFGDLVTMAWWDDLWLKESFAEWASHFALSEYGDDPDHPWATFCNSRKSWAYRQDQLPSTHPIAADMVDLEAVELNFDGITYAKGASVLRQLVAFVGLEAFLEGVRRYFRSHAFGTTELSDLLRALEGASGRDLTGWSAAWLEQAGVNTLTARCTLDPSGVYSSVTIDQSAPQEHPTLRSHRIALGLYERRDGRLRRTSRVEIDVSGESTAVDELVGVAQPDLLLVNDDDLTYAKVRLDERSLRTVLDSAYLLDSPLARAVCWGLVWDMCRDAELAAGDYVGLALRGVGSETDLTAVSTALAQGLRAATRLSHPDARDALVETWQSGLRDLLDAAQPGSDHQLALARAYAAAADTAEDAARLAGWLNGIAVPEGLAIDTSLRWLLVTNLARLGQLSADAIDAELARDNTITGAEQAAGARAAQPTEAAKAAAWMLAVEGDHLPNETQRRICQEFWQRGQSAVLAPYAERYLAAATDISAGTGVWAKKGMALRNNVLASLFPQPEEPADFLLHLDRWLAETQLADSVRRVVEERRDDTLRIVRCQAASNPRVG